MKAILAIAFGAILLSACATRDTSVAAEDRISQLSPYFQTQLPAGTGPFPAMIMVTGCSGFHNERFAPSYDRDGNRFVELGYAVTRVDFVRAYGLDNSCGSNAEYEYGDQNAAGDVVPYDDVADYILATVEYVAAQREIDADRIYLIGWSMGATGIMIALNKGEPFGEPNIAAALTYFPPCQSLSPWSARIPTLLMLAEFDNLAPTQLCKDVVREVAQDDIINVIEYPNAHHCFIAEDTPVVTEPRLEPTCAFNPEAFGASWRDILVFLENH